MSISSGRPASGGGDNYFTHINYQDIENPSNSELVQNYYASVSLSKEGVVSVTRAAGNNNSITVYKNGYRIENGVITDFSAGDVLSHYIVFGSEIYVFTK